MNILDKVSPEVVLGILKEKAQRTLSDQALYLRTLDRDDVVNVRTGNMMNKRRYTEPEFSSGTYNMVFEHSIHERFLDILFNEKNPQRGNRKGFAKKFAQKEKAKKGETARERNERIMRNAKKNADKEENVTKRGSIRSLHNRFLYGAAYHIRRDISFYFPREVQEKTMKALNAYYLPGRVCEYKDRDEKGRRYWTKDETINIEL